MWRVELPFDNCVIRGIIADTGKWVKMEREVVDVPASSGGACDLFVATTGRAGSLSLTRLLDAQSGLRAHHEPRPYLPWDNLDAPETIAQRLKRLRGNGSEAVAEVSLWLLPYADEILETTSAKLLFLLRHKQAMINSYRRKIEVSYPGKAVDHWRADRSGLESVEWDAMYPKYPVATMEEGLDCFWHEYAKAADALKAKHPERVRVMHTEDLNDPEAIAELLEWIGIERPNQKEVIPHANAIPRRATGLRGKVTGILPTYERPKSFAACVESLARYYPDMHLLIADDSRDKYAKSHMLAHPHPGGYDVFELDHDMGVGYKRNYLSNIVKTEWFAVIDDDMQLRPGTLEKLRNAAEAHGLDVAAGRAIKASKARNWEATYREADGGLYCDPVEIVAPYAPCHLVQNFAVMRTEVCRGSWDDDMKICGEHMDAFIRMWKKGVKVGAVPGAFVEDNDLDMTEVYRQARYGRGRQMTARLLSNWGYEWIKTPHGSMMKAQLAAC